MTLMHHIIMWTGLNDHHMYFDPLTTPVNMYAYPYCSHVYTRLILITCDQLYCYNTKRTAYVRAHAYDNNGRRDVIFQYLTYNNVIKSIDYVV